MKCLVNERCAQILKTYEVLFLSYIAVIWQLKTVHCHRLQTTTAHLSCFFYKGWGCIFLGQEESDLDRDYGGIPTSFVYLPATASDSERKSQLLDWVDMDEVRVSDLCSTVNVICL